MHIYDFAHQLLISFPYSDICRWSGSSSQFSLIMVDDMTNESYEFVLITSQAADMAAITITTIILNCHFYCLVAILFYHDSSNVIEEVVPWIRCKIAGRHKV